MTHTPKKRPGRKLLIAAILLALIAGAIALWLHRIEQRRLAAVAKLTPPPAYAFYRAISESGSAPSAEVMAALAHLHLNADPFDSLFAFDRVLQYHMTYLGDKPAWNAIREKASDFEFSFETWSDADDEALGILLTDHSGHILNIREAAARGGPVSRLNIDAGQSMELSHLAPVRDLARLLRADTLFHARQGAYDEVEADLFAIAQLGQALSSEPVIISQLVRFAVMGIFHRTVEDVMDTGDLPPALLQTLIDELDNMEQHDAFVQSLQGEAMMVLHSYKAIRAGELSSEAFAGQMIGGSGGVRRTQSSFIEELREVIDIVFQKLGSGLEGSVLSIPSSKIDETRYAEAMSALIEVSRQPYYQAAPGIKEMKQIADDTLPKGSLSKMLFPRMLNAGKAQARNVAYIDLVRIACALELYRHEHNAYPESLESIAETLGGDVPVDPFVGTPYHYSRTGETFLLYSVGDNEIDDGGVHDIRKGDMVWRGKAQPQPTPLVAQ